MTTHAGQLKSVEQLGKRHEEETRPIITLSHEELAKRWLLADEEFREGTSLVNANNHRKDQL